MEKDRGKKRKRKGGEAHRREFLAGHVYEVNRVLLIRAILETGLMRERTNCGKAACEEGEKKRAEWLQKTHIKIKKLFYFHQ